MSLALLTLLVSLDASGSLRATLGGELDTNARRAIQAIESDPLEGRVRPTRVVEDGLVRALVGAYGTFRVDPAHAVFGELILGTKRFLRESTEDLVAQSLALGTSHEISPDWSFSTFAEVRISRIRSGQRDYDLALGGAELRLLLGVLDLTARTYVSGFAFAVEPRFDHLGPAAVFEVGLRPLSRLRLAVRGGLLWRFYEGNGLVVGMPDDGLDGAPILTFCEEPSPGIRCSSERRRDEEAQLEVIGRFRSADLMLELRYLLRLQRSTSPLENLDRHRLAAQATAGLPFEVTASLQAALQMNDGRSLTDEQLLAEDDENQNAVQVQLQRPLTEAVDLELRWALFANQFSTTDVSFLRQTVYLGLAVHVGGR